MRFVIKKIIESLNKSSEKRRKRKNSLLELTKDLEKINDLLIQESTEKLQKEHSNPINRFGKKCFSQSDEDGITIEILKRLKMGKGFFLELGVGDGTENNSLLLLAMGWKGIWVGGNDLAVNIKNNNKLRFYKNWITSDNIIEIIKRGLGDFEKKNFDLISVDLDGNDYYIVKTILELKIFPSVFILEYNAKFPPPIDFKINYNENHKWGNDDYFGCSLVAWNELLDRFGYKLICCNTHTGANCFFVKKKFLSNFKDVPKEIEKIYSKPRYFLYKNFVHKKSLKLIEQIINY